MESPLWKVALAEVREKFVGRQSKCPDCGGEGKIVKVRNSGRVRFDCPKCGKMSLWISFHKTPVEGAQEV